MGKISFVRDLVSPLAMGGLLLELIWKGYLHLLFEWIENAILFSFRFSLSGF